MKYYKDYREWNRLKEILNSVDVSIPFKEGEIWWVYLGLNIGIEIDGKGDDFIRPAIIINRFNKYHAWIVPLTSIRNLLSGVHMPLFSSQLETNSAAVITQLQTISSNRLMNRIGIIDNIQFIKIIDSIKNILPKTQKT